MDEQIGNAVNGIKEMKSVMQQSSLDHQRYLDALEKTKQQKEVRTRCQHRFPNGVFSKVNTNNDDIFIKASFPL